MRNQGIQLECVSRVVEVGPRAGIGIFKRFALARACARARARVCVCVCVCVRACVRSSVGVCIHVWTLIKTRFISCTE